MAAKAPAHTKAYKANVPVGVKNPIMGRNVSPTTVLEPQLVAVASAEPSERTERGNNLWENFGLDQYVFMLFSSNNAKGCESRK